MLANSVSRMEDGVRKQLVSQIEIDASPEVVWEVLTDLAAYPKWNPFIVRAEGRIEIGARLTLRMQPDGARPVTVKPTVLEVAEGRRLSWLGRLVLPGMFDARHVFVLEARQNGGTRLQQTEDFHGVLVPLLARSLDRHTLPAFVAMNEAIKRQAESVVPHHRG